MYSQPRLVIVADETTRRWILVRPRPWDRLLVRLRTSTLDAQLAAGRPAEEGRHRAVLAYQLVEPVVRRELADCWQEVLSRAAAGTRVFLQRSRVLSASADIRRLIAALRASALVPARGVAIARTLLTDGAGPLYNARNRKDLQTAIRDAIRHLDPRR